jgi:hypothetical protein
MGRIAIATGVPKAKALGRAVGRHALADDQFEPAGLTVIAIAGMDVAAINADGE